MEVTKDEYIDVLIEWLRMHSGRDTLNRTAESIGYTLSSADPKKSMALLEELFALQTAVIEYRVLRLLPETDTGLVVIKGFIDKALERFGTIFANNDEGYYQRFADKHKRYLTELAEQANFVDIAVYFLENLSCSSFSSNLKSQMHMTVNINSFSQSTYNGLSKYSISSELSAADLNAPINDSEDTQLIAAARVGDIEKTNLLLSKGANPNKTNIWKLTALQVAEKEGHIELVELLKTSSG